MNLTARAATLTAAIGTGVLIGNAWAPAIMLLAAWILAGLTDYAARLTELAVTHASEQRIAELTWQLRTDAAHLALQERRLAEPEWQRLNRIAIYVETRPEPNLYTRPGGIPLLLGYAS